MPKLDDCHDQIARALQNDGWQVREKSVYVANSNITNVIYIDMQAVKGQNGTAGRNIFVEAKCFDLPRRTADLHRALGQYIVYRVILDESGLPDPLYLAVPADSLAEYFNPQILRVVQRYGIKLVVVDLAEERIIRWIE